MADKIAQGAAIVLAIIALLAGDLEWSCMFVITAAIGNCVMRIKALEAADSTQAVEL